MSWRTVVITQRCKLDLKMGYMVVRGEETKRIFINEIAVLLIENTAVSLTACLLETLINKKVKIIFCDERRNPHSSLVPLYGSYDNSGKIRKQIKWSKYTKAMIWTEIIAEKIRNQAKFLFEVNKAKEAKLVLSYLEELEINDVSNREGHAAKVYFNALFGKNFTRSEDCMINAALNYGYALVLSAFNREIEALGYLTQLGIFHDNAQNFFNLSCDLMEPFRILIDKKVKDMNFITFGSEEKHFIVSILSDYVEIDGTKQTVLNAIRIYCHSVIEAINENDCSKIKFFRYEL